MQIGVYSFVERTPDPASGATVEAATRVADLLEEVALADAVGLDVFGIGEHHRAEYLASAPACCWPRRRPAPARSASPAP